MNDGLPLGGAGRRAFLAGSASMMTFAAVPTALLAAPSPPGDAPPVARIDGVTEVFFGQSVNDPYRWMENERDPEWQAFIAGQGARTRRILDAIPGRAALARRIAELSGNTEVVNNVQVAGSFVFIEKRPTGASTFRLYVREGLAGHERLLVDPENRQRGDVAYAINFWAASPDGLRVVYGMSASGSEQSVMEIIETRGGRVLPERIDRAQFASPNWLADGSGFFFNRLTADAAPRSAGFYLNSACWLHRVGTDPQQDVRVLARGQADGPPIGEVDFPNVVPQPGCPFVVGVLYAGVQREMTLFTQTLAAATKGVGGWKPVCTAADRVVSFAARGNSLWLLTEKDAPRGRVVVVDGSDPAFERAREVLPQSGAVKRALFAARDALYVQELDGGLGRLSKCDGRAARGEGKATRVALPFDGALSIVLADPRRDGVFAGAQSWIRPAEYFHVRASGRIVPMPWVAPSPIDVSPYTSEELFVTARDGTRLPVSIVCRKGTPRDGSAPAMIDVYGAYGYGIEPIFLPRQIAWMEQGGIWVTAHVHGGGEYGSEWHDAGRGPTKPDTWHDLIDTAQFLIDRRWTSPAHLSLRGGSAGGIAVGRAMTERPELFSAVLSLVGLSNPLRAEFTANGPPNIVEFGTVKDEAGFKGLYAMDSTVHVEPGTRYPAVMLTTGLNDPRVNSWHAGKMTARLQAADPDGNPVLMRVDALAGHALGATRDQRDLETTDEFAFALWQARVTAFQPAK